MRAGGGYSRHRVDLEVAVLIHLGRLEWNRGESGADPVGSADRIAEVAKRIVGIVRRDLIVGRTRRLRRRIGERWKERGEHWFDDIATER